MKKELIRVLRELRAFEYYKENELEYDIKLVEEILVILKKKGICLDILSENLKWYSQNFMMNQEKLIHRTM